MWFQKEVITPVPKIAVPEITQGFSKLSIVGKVCESHIINLLNDFTLPKISASQFGISLLIHMIGSHIDSHKFVWVVFFDTVLVLGLLR